MASIIILPVKYENTTVPVQCDFISPLVLGDSLVACSVTVSVFSGVDATPSTILFSTVTISNDIATQIVTAGVVGVVYMLMFSGTTAYGNNVVMYGRLAVISDNPF